MHERSSQVDTLFQSLSPSLHVIIEAHPDVLRHMKERGWYDKPGVKIFEGKWQDVVHSEQLGCDFDMVYTDTFSEDYQALRDFITHLPRLMGPKSCFSWFNGLSATNITLYDVATKVADLHLAEAGFDVEWTDVDVRFQADRWGDSRPYFTCPTYRLPLVKRR